MQTGIELPRCAIDRSRIGGRVGRRRQGADLLFFASDTKRTLVTHVGIYEGGGVMIDASQRGGRVGRDDLDEAFWAERFMLARRISATAVTHPAPRPQTRSASRIGGA